ncbi:MAG: tetratricopeptide repeat protein [Planctomycetota bacterium]
MTLDSRLEICEDGELIVVSVIRIIQIEPNHPISTPTQRCLPEGHRGGGVKLVGTDHRTVARCTSAGFCHHAPPPSPFVPLLGKRATMSRREQIEAMLADEPADTFLRYSLAMELRREGDIDAALGRFDELTQGEPAYVPAFFMAAQTLAENGQIDAARRQLRDGIDEARRQGDSHAAAEMSEMLASLGTLGETDDDELDDDL